MSVSPVPKLARVPAGDVDIPGYPGLSLAPDLTTSTLTPVRRVAPGWPFEQHGTSVTAGPVMKVRSAAKTAKSCPSARAVLARFCSRLDSC